MELPALDLGQGHAAVRGAVDSQEKFVPSRRRRAAGAEARRDQAVGIAQRSRIDGKPDRVVGPAGAGAVDHAAAIERINADAVKGGVIGKHVHRQVIGRVRLFHKANLG